jgi:SWI/SNF-related matrix-associated actin-dependent regulator of chromatin subfamily A3
MSVDAINVDLDRQDKGGNSDFVNEGDEGDDSFAEDDDVVEVKPKKNAGKGKGKATSTMKDKGKTQKAVDFNLDSDSDTEPENDFASIFNQNGNGGDDGDVNPKVMLISLKAGALGLNLTV